MNRIASVGKPAKLAVLVLLLVLAAPALAGCGSGAIAAPASLEGSSSSLSAASAHTPTTATAESTATAPRATVTITDEAGRKVIIPDSIERVYCTSPMGTNLMFMLAPDMMVGWNVTPTQLEKQYIPVQYRSVIGLGGWYGKDTTGNVEEIIKQHPDVIFDVGTLDQSSISDANRIHGLLNIPVIMVDGSLTKSGDALRYIGKLIHREARADELAAYCDGVIQEAQRISASLPNDKKVRVYYAEGIKGLNTDPSGSLHTEVLDLAGGINVAQVGVDPSGYGMSPVSMEQVLLWNPQVILVASDPTQETDVYDQITTESQWATVAAVKNHQVYQIPRGPFDWFDRPPSIGCILGVRWLGNLLYPDLYKYDMKTEVKQFYKLFYQIDLSDQQLQTLMAHAVRNQ